MKKRLLVMAVLAAILLTTCMSMLVGCEDEKPRDVLLELVNPITGDIIKEGDTVDLPTEKTPFQIRVKDKVTGEYLTDDDIPENTIEGSCRARITAISSSGKSTIPLYTYGKWPMLEDLQFSSDYNHYRVDMYFEYASNEVVLQPKFKRKYFDEHQSIRIFINKE